MTHALTLAARGGSLPRGLHFSQFGGIAADLQTAIVGQLQPTSDTRQPGAQPSVETATSPIPPIGQEGELFLELDVAARRRFYNFLELSYNGSLEYKHGFDARGYRLLIEHENEVAPYGSADATNPDLQNRPDADATKSNRYARRLRVAIYENHVAPIVEKFVGYLVRNTPKRSSKVQAEMQRLRLADKMTAYLRSALTLTQYFPGWDAAKVAPPVGPVTKAVAASVDPAHGLQPYLIGVDPRRVLDVDYNSDGDIVRLCYEEETRFKASITSKPKVQYAYKEWHPTHWVLWEPVVDEKDVGEKPARLVPTHGLKVRVKDAGPHSFGRVPFVSFEPKFPTETLCDLNRALFNLTSLLYEELYSNTFTQFYVLGARASDVKNAERGTGNTIVIEAETARIGTFGAVEGQAQAIRQSIEDVRNQIYAVASMNESATKNVAESAEKKKRDLEALYTALLSIVRTMETVENKLLVGIGLANPADESSLTRYPDKFDIASVADLLDEIASLKEVPFAPTSLKRSLTKQLAAKMDPFGPKHDPDVDTLFDASPALVGSVVDLLTAKAATPEMVVAALGVPPAYKAAVIAQLTEHAAEPVPVVPPGLRPEDLNSPDGQEPPEDKSEKPDADKEDDQEDNQEEGQEDDSKDQEGKS